MMSIETATMPIVAAAAAEVVVSALWYSDNLFGPMWKKLGGKSAPAKDFYQNLAIHGVASVVSATALFIAIVVFQKTQTSMYTQAGFGKIFGMFLTDATHNNELMSSMKIAAFLWLGFFVPQKVICGAWTGANWTKKGIEAGGQLVSLVAMAAMIASMS